MNIDEKMMEIGLDIIDLEMYENTEYEVELLETKLWGLYDGR